MYLFLWVTFEWGPCLLQLSVLLAGFLNGGEKASYVYNRALEI